LLSKFQNLTSLSLLYAANHADGFATAADISFFGQFSRLESLCVYNLHPTKFEWLADKLPNLRTLELGDLKRLPFKTGEAEEIISSLVEFFRSDLRKETLTSLVLKNLPFSIPLSRALGHFKKLEYLEIRLNDDKIGLKELAAAFSGRVMSGNYRNFGKSCSELSSVVISKPLTKRNRISTTIDVLEFLKGLAYQRPRLASVELVNLIDPALLTTREIRVEGIEMKTSETYLQSWNNLF